ncbi:MAG: hypothetical protein J1E64_11745 [Acetatifactor sp.]|nr:hypothetical protein [Acetatifactor sp.]
MSAKALCDEDGPDMIWTINRIEEGGRKVMRRRGMGIMTAALALVLTACSAKSDPNSQGTEVSQRGQGEESEETNAGQVEDYVNDVDMEDLIPEQTFDVTLDGWGEVTFASFIPKDWSERGSEQGNDVRFRLLREDQVIYAFPGLTEEEKCYSSEWFVEIDAVTFQDYNMDGRTDVVVITTYEPYSGRTEDYFKRARVYFQEEGGKGFYLDHALEEWLMTQGHTDSIADIMKTREEYQDHVWAMEGNASIDNQLGVIADACGNWAQDLEYADEIYRYAVVNLDMDDRLGLIVANCGGTGFYTYSNFYEVSRGCDELVEIPVSYREGESQADIIQDNVTAYLELREPEAWDDAGTWHYVFRDSMKDGAAKYYETLWDLTLSDDQIKPSVMGTYTYTVDAGTHISYQNGQGQNITEKEYDTLAENFFADWTKAYTFTLGWQDVAELEGLSREERIEKLRESWQKFHMMEAEE